MVLHWLGAQSSSHLNMIWLLRFCLEIGDSLLAVLKLSLQRIESPLVLLDSSSRL